MTARFTVEADSRKMKHVALRDPSTAARIEPRIPFFAPVVVSGVQRCWATNICSGGIGLIGYARDQVPAQGDVLELEWELGERKAPIHASGRIAWISSVRKDGRIGLGIAFTAVAAPDRAEIARFLAEHRPRVLIALADPEEEAQARRALGHLALEHAAEASELTDEQIRSCASILVFGHDAERMTAFLDRLWKTADAGLVPGEAPLAPITLCTTVAADRLLTMFTPGRSYEVIRPPFERRKLAQTVDRACGQWTLQAELRWASVQLEGIALRQTLAPPLREPPAVTSTRLIRAGTAMQHVYALIQTVAAHDVPVLLAGETGTGKELAAREIHALSPRVHTPFVAQDCGALTETLLESELFGHVRGAFTGATTDHPGLFQIADGGTIFLDEIQNTSPGLQAKLLRVVEEGEIRPVGGAKPRRVDVRLITASNVDLRQAVKDGRFRADFYYRLNRFPIELPPLRERREDILPLAGHFLEMLCARIGRLVPGFEPAAEAALVAYGWPGNVRELKNAIERALLLTPPGEVVRRAALPVDVRGDANAVPQTLDALVDAYERGIIRAALERNSGVVRRAARELSVDAVTLARRMRRLGIRR